MEKPCHLSHVLVHTAAPCSRWHVKDVRVHVSGWNGETKRDMWCCLSVQTCVWPGKCEQAAAAQGSCPWCWNQGALHSWGCCSYTSCLASSTIAFPSLNECILNIVSAYPSNNKCVTQILLVFKVKLSKIQFSQLKEKRFMSFDIFKLMWKVLKNFRG